MLLSRTLEKQDGKNMVQILDKIWVKYGTWIGHILPIGLFCQFFTEYKSHITVSGTKFSMPYGKNYTFFIKILHNTRISYCNLISYETDRIYHIWAVFLYAIFFLPCCTILAHKRAFFNAFFIKSPTKSILQAGL